MSKKIAPKDFISKTLGEDIREAYRKLFKKNEHGDCDKSFYSRAEIKYVYSRRVAKQSYPLSSNNGTNDILNNDSACQAMTEVLKHSNLPSREISCISIARLNATIASMINAHGKWAILQDDDIRKDLHKIEC